MRKTKEEAEVTRQNLLKAGLAVFSRKGYSDTRLEDIAEEAGVTRGAIYHHFGGKAELYTELVGEISARVNPIMEEALAEGGTVLETLKRVLVRTLVYTATDEDFRAVMELTYFKTAYVPEIEQGMAQKVAGIRAMVDAFADHIQSGIDAGNIRHDVNPRDAAIALIAYQNGVLTQWLLDRKLFSLKERAESMAEIFIRGIAAS